MGSTVINQGGYYSKTITNDFTILDCDRCNLRVDATLKDIVIQLPNFSSLTILASGFIRIEKIDNTANKVIIKPFQSVTSCTINAKRDNIELSKQNESILTVFDNLFLETGFYNCSVVAINIQNNNNNGYSIYDNYSELPLTAIAGTIVIVLNNSTILTNTYSAGLWEYANNSWKYIGISVDNSTLIYNNNVLQVNVGTTANKILQLDSNALLPSVSSENTTIGTISKNNTKIVGGENIKTAMGKTQGQLDNKNNLVVNGTVDNLVSLDSTGQVKDSGFSVQSSGALSALSTEIPTSEIVTNAIAYAVTKPSSFMGTYDASSNEFPITGSGVGGAIVAGDTWIISVAGTLGDTPVNIGNTIVAKFNNPEQDPNNWWIDPNPNIDSLNDLGGAVIIKGADNQIIVTINKQSIVLSLPQNIDTSANTEFSTIKATSSTKQIKTSGTGSLSISTTQDTVSVVPKEIESKKFLTEIKDDGIVSNAQPFFSDVLNIVSATQIADFTATINTMYAVDSTDGIINIIVPSTVDEQTIPANSLIFIYDIGNKANINKIIIKNTIGTVIATIDSNGQMVQFSYNGFTSVWQIISQCKIDNNGTYINPIPSTATPLGDQVVNWAYITSQYANLAPINPLQIYVDGVYGSDISGKGTVFSPFSTITKGLTSVTGSGNILCNTANYTNPLVITKDNVLITCYNNTNIYNFKYVQTSTITISGTATRNSFQGMQINTGANTCITHTSSKSILNFQNCSFITSNAIIATLGGNVTSNAFNYMNWCDFTSSVANNGYIVLANNTNNSFTANFANNSNLIVTTASLTAGQFITGNGISAGTIVLQLITTNTYAISQNTTAAGSSTTLYRAITWNLNNCNGLRINIGLGHLVFAYNCILGENGITNALIGRTENYYVTSTPLIATVTTYSNMLALNFTNFGGVGYIARVTNDTTVANNGLWQCIAYPFTLTANALIKYDANKNINANNTINKITDRVTSGTTIVLTAGSTYTQRFTGTVEQTVQLPDASTLNVGFPFCFQNESTNNIKLKLYSLADLITVIPNTDLLIMLSAKNNTDGAWHIQKQLISNNQVTNTMLAQAPAHTLLANATENTDNIDYLSFSDLAKTLSELPINNFSDSAILTAEVQIALFNLPTNNNYQCELPEPSLMTGLPIVISNTTNNNSSLTLLGAATSYILYKFQTALCYSDGNVWVILISSPANVLTNVLPSGQMWVGNTSGISTPRTLTGPVTINNQGVTNIGSNQITTAMINNDAVTTSKIPDNAITDSKLAQMSALTIKGNNSENAANASDLSVDDVRAMYGIPDMKPVLLTGNATVTLTTAQQVVSCTVTAIKVVQLPNPTLCAGAVFYVSNNITSTNRVALVNNVDNPTYQLNLFAGQNCVVQSTGRSSGQQWVTITKPLSTIIPNFSSYLNANTTVSAQEQTVPLQEKEFDTAGCFNNTPNTVTLNGIQVPAYGFAPNVAGYYQLNACVRTNNLPANTSFIALLNKTGTLNKQGSFLTTPNVGLNASVVSSIIYLNGITDYVLFRVYCDVSVMLASNGPIFTYFNGAFLNAG